MFSRWSLTLCALFALGCALGFGYSHLNRPQSATLPGVNGAPQMPTVAVGGVEFPDLEGVFAYNMTVQAVPLPAAAWLLFSGMAGLAALRRRSRERPVPLAA